MIKIICDSCGKEIIKGEDHNLDFHPSNLGENKRFNLHEDCHKKFIASMREFINRLLPYTEDGL